MKTNPKGGVNKNLDNFLQSIFNEIKNEKTFSPSLFGGMAGVVLFVCEYYKYSKREDVFLAFQNLFHQLIDRISECNGLSFSNGLAGIGWLFDYLSKENVVEEGIESMLKEIDDYVINHIDYDYESSDFMHGSLGMILYFIKRKKWKVVDNILSSIKATAISRNGMFWISYIEGKNNKSKEIINLSLAHGSAAVVVLLSKLLKKDIPVNKQLIMSVLYPAITFIQKRKLEGASNFYPGYCNISYKKDIENVYGRLSWCYGDMGIGLSFWQAGVALNDSMLKKEAESIYEHILVRRLPEENEIIDACICHGTGGIAHMYNRMYYNTRNVQFRETATYWINETLKMAKFKDGIAGYKSWNVDQYTNEHNFIGGVAGIGLSLLSHLSEEHANWDECLLLS